jgi:preprotein translocase subunit YajC
MQQTGIGSSKQVPFSIHCAWAGLGTRRNSIAAHSAPPPKKRLDAARQKEKYRMASLVLFVANPLQSLTTFAPFILIFVVFYMFMIRPGQRRQKTWQEMLSNLKSGDRVTTTGGIRGIILSVKDDVVQIRVAPDNIKLEVVKSAIASVTTAEDEVKP